MRRQIWISPFLTDLYYKKIDTERLYMYNNHKMILK